MVLEKELLNIELNDDRLNRRAITIGNYFMQNPNKSIPVAMKNWAMTKACYRLLNNRKVTRHKLLQSHIEQTQKRCETAGEVIVVQDTTTLSFPDHESKKGFGATGTQSGIGRGMLVHTSLAIRRDTREPLGVIHQKVIIRKAFHSSEESHKDRLKRSMESEKWLDGFNAVKELFPAKHDINIVADREGDIYTFMKDVLDSGYNFTIRQTRDRKTDHGYISDVINTTIPRGEMSVHIRKNGNRKERTARIVLSSMQNVSVCSPRIIDRSQPPITINIVVAKESLVSGNNGEELLWVLLTTLPVDTEEDCRKVVEIYQTRWMIEEFHKGLKTGCGIEERQLIDVHAIENLLAFFSIISVILIHLRYSAKGKENNSVELITPIQKMIIKNEFKNMATNPTTQELLIGIARLGGFLARKGDGDPGWISLIRGFMKLAELEKGFQFALELMGKR